MRTTIALAAAATISIASSSALADATCVAAAKGIAKISGLTITKSDSVSVTFAHPKLKAGEEISYGCQRRVLFGGSVPQDRKSSFLGLFGKAAAALTGDRDDIDAAERCFNEARIERGSALEIVRGDMKCQSGTVFTISVRAPADKNAR